MKIAKDIVSGIANTFPLEDVSDRKSNEKFVRADDKLIVQKLKKKGLNVGFIKNT
ncbi:hypothetical protein D3C73_1673960 [compost metagenome]